MTSLVIRNTELLDCTGADPRAGIDVAVSGSLISGIGRGVGSSPDRVIDAAGLTLMAGLTDAHVHMGLVSPAGGIGDLPWIDYVFTVRRIIENTLQEGFTTVRDAGGLDPHWARLVEQGVIDGPRILPSGSVLSQTGGHGDLRPAHHIEHPRGSIPGLSATPEIVDGVDEVRRAAREQLRKGATQIKVFSSGGVLSPTDPFDSSSSATRNFGPLSRRRPTGTRTCLPTATPQTPFAEPCRRVSVLSSTPASWTRTPLRE